MKHHRNILPLAVVIVGFLLIIIDHSLHAHSWMLVAGGLLIASAHLLNWKLLHGSKNKSESKAPASLKSNSTSITNETKREFA